MPTSRQLSIAFRRVPSRHSAIHPEAAFHLPEPLRTGLGQCRLWGITARTPRLARVTAKKQTENFRPPEALPVYLHQRTLGGFGELSSPLAWYELSWTCSPQRISRAGHLLGGKRGGFAVRPCYPQSAEPISSHTRTRGQKRHVLLTPADQREDVTAMPEVNPTAVIAECIEKSKATADQELIANYITETLGILQIDNTEEDAFHMLGSAIADAVADDDLPIQLAQVGGG